MKLTKIIELLESAKSQIESLKEAKQETFDNRSEKWQESEKGEAAQELLDQLESMYDNIHDAISAAEEIEEA